MIMIAKMISFFHQTFKETKKITWPKINDVNKTLLMIMAVIFTAMLIFAICDAVIFKLIQLIITIGR